MIIKTKNKQMNKLSKDKRYYVKIQCKFTIDIETREWTVAIGTGCAAQLVYRRSHQPMNYLVRNQVALSIFAFQANQQLPSSAIFTVWCSLCFILLYFMFFYTILLIIFLSLYARRRVYIATDVIKIFYFPNVTLFYFLLPSSLPSY